MDSTSLLRQLFAAFPNRGQKVNEETLDVYLRLLADIPVEELAAVVDACIQESKFLPTVAEIRTLHARMPQPAPLPRVGHWTQLAKGVYKVSAA